MYVCVCARVNGDVYVIRMDIDSIFCFIIVALDVPCTVFFYCDQ